MNGIPQLRVKEICKERGITLKQLAEKMGVAPETLTRAISENANPTLATLNKIASCLGVGLDELVVDAKPQTRICGHIEVDGVVHKIKSVDDLENIISVVKNNHV